VKKFPITYNLDPEKDTHYRSNIFKHDGDKEEITADKPIQVRINNGPWINVRPSDLNKLKE
tara:strand:- start:718 stop:900 length:183 start_codon:yes stop_codon:yes gene_type:complete